MNGDVFNVSVQATGSPGSVNDLYAVASLPNRSLPVPGADSVYSCIWGFQQEFTGSGSAPASIMGDIYLQGSQGFGTVGGYTIGYAISGTNDFGPIQTDYTTVNAPTQSTLQGKAPGSSSSSSFVISGTDPWTHFPTTNIEVRHPGEAYCDNYSC